MPALRLTLLGGFDLGPENGPAISLPRKKAQALLAYLALHPEEAQPRDKLAALLWGELSDERARHGLRQCLVDLRKALSRLAPSALAIEPDSVRLDPDGLEIDVAAFERLVRDGALASLERATSLYRGDLLEGLGVKEPALEEWLLAERERLRELAVTALARLLAHQARSQAAEPAVQTALRLLALDPLQEAVHRTLMRLYAGQGRRGGALRQYQVCIDVLQRELGVEPEAETSGLYQEILQAPSARPSIASPGLARPMLRTAPTTLVGRDPEIDQLRHACEEAWSGRGGVVMLSGEAGIGKTRLVEALVVEALERGGRALVGRAHESEQILPFGVWTDALRAGGVVAELTDQPDAGGAWRRDLERLLPELGAADRADDVADDHVRLFEALARVVEHVAAARPVLLVLEDLHWADEMSLRVLGYVSRRAARWPVLLVGTARPEEMIDVPALRRVLGELGRTPDFLPLTLSRLSGPDTVALVAALARSGTARDAIERLGHQVWRASEGNPFMVVETMRVLRDRGDLDELPADLSTPPRVRDLIESRLERLGERAAQVAAAAAVVGREVDFELLRQAAGMTAPEAAAGVEELVTRRILGVMGERLDFTHDQIRNVTYARLLTPRRRLLHAAVAVALESLGGDDLDRHALALGLHWREAERWDLAFEYFGQAGRAALARAAHREAFASFEAALAVSEKLPATRETIEQTIDLRFDLRQAAVPLFEYGRILAALTAAEDAARAAGDQSRLGWALAYQTHARQVAGDARGAEAAGAQALEIATAQDDPRLRAAVNAYLSWVYLWIGEHRRVVALLRENVGPLAVRLARAGADPVQPVYSRTWLAAALAELGDFAEAEGLADEAVRIAEARQSAYDLLHASWGQGAVALRRGEDARAVAALERSVDVCRRLEFPFYGGVIAAFLGHAYMRVGRMNEALDLLEGAVGAVTQQAGGWSALATFLAEGYFRAGRIEDAKPLAEQALRVAGERGERGFEAWARRLVAEITAAGAPPATEVAGAEYRAAMALAEDLGMRPLLALCHLGLGRLWRSGRRDEARAELETARALLGDLGMTAWQHQAEADLAGLLS
jgi:DNA-binding SARP family transcriptional activator